MSTHGLPVTSRTLPLSAPSCAAARGATAQSSAAASKATHHHDLFPCERSAANRQAVHSRRDREALNFDSFMLDSPFVAGRLLPEVPRGAMRPIISNLRRNPSSTGGDTLTVRNR